MSICSNNCIDCKMDVRDRVLSELGFSESDILIDNEGREYVIDREEVGNPSEEGYNFSERKIIVDDLVQDFIQ